jgi:Autographiviridae endonuclease VII
MTKEQNRKYKLKMLYGITPEQYNYLSRSQNYGCAICSRKESEERHGFLHVDHDKVTGAVRGLLCSKCNLALGLLQEDVDIAKEAFKYLKNQQAHAILSKVVMGRPEFEDKRKNGKATRGTN